MPVNVLPHQLDFLRYWKHIKCAEEEPGIIPVRKEIVDIVVSDVEKIWSSASIPTIEFLLSITMRINVLIDSYLNLSKSAKRDGEKEAYKRKVEG